MVSSNTCKDKSSVMLSEGSYIVSGMILRQLVAGEVRATICSEEMSWRDI